MIYPHVRHTLQQLIHSHDKVLELGCGPGQYRTVTLGRYIGLDLTADDYKAGVPRTPDVVGSATALPFADNVLDCIFACTAFYQFRDQRTVLRECYRVLRKGGQLLIFDYNRRTLTHLRQAGEVEIPNWTQWGLKRLIQSAGFKRARLQLGQPRPGWRRWACLRPLRLLWNELRGGWAIVFAEK